LVRLAELCRAPTPYATPTARPTHSIAARARRAGGAHGSAASPAVGQPTHRHHWRWVDHAGAGSTLRTHAPLSAEVVNARITEDQPMLARGDRAPEFAGTLADGQQLRLKDFHGRRHVILYFFPKDFTPGCTREACTFRDRRADVAALGAEVVGVSLDPPEKHARFAATYELPYPLVSDADAKIANAYGVARVGGWLPSKRVTFVIDKDGVVQQVIQSEFSIHRHIEEAIDTLRKLQRR